MKQVLKDIKRESRTRTPYRAKQWFKWLSPGLSYKRWLLLSATGVLFVGLGVAIWTKLTPVFYLLQFTKGLLGTITNLIPNYISGPLVVLAGILFVFWGQTRSMGSIRDALQPESDGELIDALIQRRRLHRGPKIVAIGGGTGLSTLLRGLKAYSANITAVVTVADDGGSSGRLRRDFGMLPPGDIRNCLAALADEETLLAELFQYRFRGGSGLSGHSFGNLFLTAMAEITGDLEQAVAASSRVLAVRGQVLPATLTDVTLWARLEDGRRIEGESSITEARGKIAEIGCLPERPPALPRVLDAIAEADAIVIGPGSLYTSIIPNLLVPDIVRAIAKRNVPCIYVCNIMTEPGETDGYTVSDHVRAIDRACGDRQLFETVLVQNQQPSAQALIRYAQKKSHPVDLDRDVVERLGRQIFLANIMSEDPASGSVRHNSSRLARVLMRWFERQKRGRWGEKM
ncbi:gluconeogenesis factor YvcK family protein [Baaleninema simplex]|uniref:gluconeogenesis factor YvcK family protein n=1 Tax=Baaleninema simplex TaxID=2862350 RepID=UPI0003489A7F|nr:gluconeogenesis factor YvcK family protein [Baaleninema simplex]